MKIKDESIKKMGESALDSISLARHLLSILSYPFAQFRTPDFLAEWCFSPTPIHPSYKFIFKTKNGVIPLTTNHRCFPVISWISSDAVLGLFQALLSQACPSPLSSSTAPLSSLTLDHIHSNNSRCRTNKASLCAYFLHLPEVPSFSFLHTVAKHPFLLGYRLEMNWPLYSFHSSLPHYTAATLAWSTPHQAPR